MAVYICMYVYIHSLIKEWIVMTSSSCKLELDQPIITGPFRDPYDSWDVLKMHAMHKICLHIHTYAYIRETIIRGWCIRE